MRVDKRIAKNDIEIDGDVIIKKGEEVLTSQVDETVEGDLVVTVFSRKWITIDVSELSLVEVDVYGKSSGIQFSKGNVNYLDSALKVATAESLTLEILISSFMYAQSHPKATLPECIGYGISEWIK